MRRSAVLGHPIGHSLSPLIFEQLAKKNKVDLIYDILDVEPSALDSKISEIKKNYDGISITRPFKEKMLTHADERSSEVKALGATNCMTFKNGQAKAHNTDVEGILKTLDAHGVKLKGKKMLIIGAGGAARALVYAGHSRGLKDFYIFNRSVKRLEEMKFSLSKQLSGLNLNSWEKGSGGIDIMANATPSGMEGIKEEGVDFKSLFDQGGSPFAFELVYRPLQTPFLVEAQRRKLNCVGGLEMLLFQAQRAWQIIFGESSFDKDFNSTLLAELKKKI